MSKLILFYGLLWGSKFNEEVQHVNVNSIF